jgi:hypothetical protein
MVRECYYHRYHGEEEARAEQAAEMAAERYYEERGYDEARAFEEWEARQGKVSYEQARDAAEAANAARPEPVTEGIWKLGDQIYKVVVAVHGSGKLYAKRLVVSGDRSAHWAYEPGVIRTLQSSDRAHKLTEAEAAEFGKLYGVCAICGRTLTNEESIERGIGPICAGKQGW